jgi:hypothetical protein
LTFLDDDGAGDLFDGHGDHQHVRMSRSTLRLGVFVFGSMLIAAVVSGMFLY